MSMSKSVCSCFVSEHTTSLTKFGTRSAKCASGNVQRRAKYNELVSTVSINRRCCGDRTPKLSR
jgi:hypothetical protein